MNRHDYLIVNAAGRLYAYGQARENPECAGIWYRKTEEISCGTAETESIRQWFTEYDAHLQELLLERHGDFPVPAILRRQDNTKEGYIQVGWSSWKTDQEVRFRLSVEIPEHTVERVITPYELFADRKCWPECLKEQLSKVEELGSRCGISIGLIGAAGMEALTGMPYLRESSDVDLIVSRQKGGCLEEFYEEVGRIPGRRLDMELQIAGKGGVKLAEWMSDSKTVLVKGECDLSLYDKAELKP